MKSFFLHFLSTFHRNVQAAWTEDHALAWHLEQKFRDNSTAWALEKCLAWDQLEVQLPNFLNEIIDCPCTLAQARADTGRFHVSITLVVQAAVSYFLMVQKCKISRLFYDYECKQNR